MSLSEINSEHDLIKITDYTKTIDSIDDIDSTWPYNDYLFNEEVFEKIFKYIFNKNQDWIKLLIRFLNKYIHDIEEIKKFSIYWALWHNDMLDEYENIENGLRDINYQEDLIDDEISTLKDSQESLEQSFDNIQAEIESHCNDINPLYIDDTYNRSINKIREEMKLDIIDGEEDDVDVLLSELEDIVKSFWKNDSRLGDLEDYKKIVKNNLEEAEEFEIEMQNHMYNRF